MRKGLSKPGKYIIEPKKLNFKSRKRKQWVFSLSMHCHAASLSVPHFGDNGMAACGNQQHMEEEMMKWWINEERRGMNKAHFHSNERERNTWNKRRPLNSLGFLPLLRNFGETKPWGLIAAIVSPLLLPLWYSIIVIKVTTKGSGAF